MAKCLLICTEGDYYPLRALAKRLSQVGFYVDLILHDRFSIFLNRDLIDSDAHRYGFTLVLANELLACYLERTHLIDCRAPEYLTEIDRKFPSGPSLNTLSRLDFGLVDHYHDCRLYNNNTGLDPSVLFARQIYLAMGLMEGNNYSLMLTIGTAGFLKGFFYKVASNSGIPFLTFEEARIGSFYRYYTNFTIGSDYAAKQYLNSGTSSLTIRRAAEDFCLRFRNSGASAYSRHVETLGRESSDKGFLKLLRHLLVNLKRRVSIFKSYIRTGNAAEYYPLMPTWWTVSRELISNYLRISFYRLLTKSINYIPDGDFIYFPLHTMPESNTAIHGESLDEISLLCRLLLKLPAGYKVYVKIPPAANFLTGYPRRISFYRKLINLPGVCVISTEVPSIELITRSRGVCCIAGTALLEAALLGKVAIAMGRPEFECISSITHFDDFSPRMLDEPVDSDVTKYIEFIHEDGIELDRNLLLNSGESGSADVNREIDKYVSYTFAKLRELELFGEMVN